MVDGVRILVGDDDRVNQLVLQGMLKRLGYGCTVVGTGTEVVEAVTQESFDVLFLDVQLPDIDGFEVVRKIREQQPAPGTTKIAFVSGHDAADFRSEMEELDVEFFVTKPVTSEALENVLNS